MRSGTLIDYRIRVHRLPLRWPMEIREWGPPRRLVDVQPRGPYALWHHTHSFEEQSGGTLCGDFLQYRPRGGTLIYWLFVRRDVKRIFEYRQQRLRERFDAAASDAMPQTSGRVNPAGQGPQAAAEC